MSRPRKIDQERIGVHPSNWRLSSADEAMLEGCDPKIAPFVRLLRAGNFETFESCDGGVGHSYPEPTISFHGSDAEGFRALSWLIDNGVKPHNLRRYWSIHGGLPHGPDWQVTFMIIGDHQ